MGNLIVLGMIAIVIFLLCYYFSKAKCPYCGSRNCTFLNSIDAGSEIISIQKEEVIEHYNKEQLNWNQPKPGEKPSSISKRKYYVPATRYFFDSTYRCNKCNSQFVRTEHRDVEN